MASWADLRATELALAEAGERLLAPTGTGVAFLATVRADGGPRVHPVMPVLAQGTLHVFVVDLSPKYQDLLRDARYALHALPPAEGGEEFYLTGRATVVQDASSRAAVIKASGGRLGGHDFEALFALDVRRVLYTKWTGWGTAEVWPEFTRWRAPAEPRAGRTPS